MLSFLETDEIKAEAMKLAPYAEEGRMYGVMSVNDGRIFKAFAGSIGGKYSIPGFVPPCFDPDEFDRISSIYSPLIHAEQDAEKRRALSDECLSELRKLYRFNSMEEPFSFDFRAPTGTGDCAGLKLISYAVGERLEMTGLAEFMVKDGKISFYPPCRERCDLLLPRIFGIDMIYADKSIAVVNKPSGLLSVPGKEVEDSVSYRFHRLFPSSPKECFTHRLDMDTSGLLVLAFTKEAHRCVSMQFEARSVEKEYEALLEGVLAEDEGLIDIPIRLDTENRPYQIADWERGKRAVTQWKRLSVEVIDGRKYTRVRFFPQTGRTHQLRVHSALIGHPIKGDRLYGTRRDGERLALHAASIAFDHPESGKRVSFTVPAPF